MAFRNLLYGFFLCCLLQLNAKAQTHFSLQTGMSWTKKDYSDIRIPAIYDRIPFASFRLSVTKEKPISLIFSREIGFSFSKDGFHELKQYDNTLAGYSAAIYRINESYEYYFLELLAGMRFNFKVFNTRMSVLNFISPGLVVKHQIKSDAVFQNGVISKYKNDFDIFSLFGTFNKFNVLAGMSINTPIRLSEKRILNIGTQFRYYLRKTDHDLPVKRHVYSLGINLDVRYVSGKAIKKAESEPEEPVALSKLFFRNHISIDAAYLFFHNNFKVNFNGKGYGAQSFGKGFHIGFNYYFNFPDRYTLSLGMNYAIQNYIVRYSYYPYLETPSISRPFAILNFPARVLFRLNTGNRTYITPSIGINGVYNFSLLGSIETFSNGKNYPQWGTANWYLVFDQATVFKNVINPEIGIGINHALNNNNIINLNMRCTYESKRVKGSFNIYEKNIPVGIGLFYEKGPVFSIDVNYIWSRSKKRS